jgi:hypothetical protein
MTLEAQRSSCWLVGGRRDRVELDLLLERHHSVHWVRCSEIRLPALGLPLLGHLARQMPKWMPVERLLELEYLGPNRLLMLGELRRQEQKLVVLLDLPLERLRRELMQIQ